MRPFPVHLQVTLATSWMTPFTATLPGATMLVAGHIPMRPRMPAVLLCQRDHYAHHGHEIDVPRSAAAQLSLRVMRRPRFGGPGSWPLR